jgi:peptidoglycan/xylan/chitin deacetylase (PgdA/CDA1 family)
MSLFRFPTGSYDKESINLMIDYKLYPIGWSIDTRDWELKNLKKIYDSTIKIPVKSGDIVLLHNGYSFSKELFDKLLTYYEDKGFSFLKVSDLIYRNNFKVENGKQISNSVLKYK